jgi:predicted DCC family thiol-disulfide oxidoreductase YuxK
VSVESGRNILFYDGVCGLCDRLVQFVLKRDRRRRFDFATLQGPFAAETLARFGRDATDLDTVYVLTSDGRLLDRGRAVLFALGELGPPWSVLALFRVLPRRVIDWFYMRVAKNRYRIFGRLDACRVPSPDERARFLG